MIRRLKKETPREQQLEILGNKIRSLYDAKKDLAIKGLIRNQPINSLIEALEEIDDIQITSRFLILSRKIKMSEFFLSLSESTQQNLLKTVKGGVISYLLEDLNFDDVYELFVKSPPHIQKKIILNSSKELKKEIKAYKKFGFGEVGSIMNTSFIYLSNDITVLEAIGYLKDNNAEFDIGEEVFVVDSTRNPIGCLKVKELMFCDNSKPIAHITNRSFMNVFTTDDIDDVIDIFKKYSPSSVAVLNEEKTLVGIINYQDIIPEILESTTEDIYKLYGIIPQIKPYLASTVFEVVKSRIVCLILLLFVATLTTFAIDKFESLGVNATAGLSSAILVPIIPIIMGMCGNTGSQSAATVIQGVSSGEMRFKDFRKVLNKELKIAFVVGGILALFNFLRLVGYFALFPVDASKLKTSTSTSLSEKSSQLYSMALIGSLSSSLSLWFVVIFSKLVGSLIPFLAIKFDYDPSSVSSPILTTVLDTVSSIIFFGLGVLMLHYTINPILGMTVSSGSLTTIST